MSATPASILKLTMKIVIAGAGEVGFIPRVEFVDRWHDVDHNCEPLYQYGLALSYSEHPFYDSPMNRIRKID